MQVTVIEAERVAARSHVRLALLPLLAGSGFAALIYEIVWLQLLQLVIGSSAISLGLLLAAYMGGLCLGSAALPRLVSRTHHPLRVYAFLELGIGAFGILALFGIPLIGRVYVHGLTGGIAGLVLRGLVAGVCLLPPTILMGGSFPALSRWMGDSPQDVSWLGWLYSSNIAGAVLGCGVGGFYLLRVFDMGVATYAAAVVNLAIASLAVILARYSTYQPARNAGSRRRAPSPQGAILVHIAIGVSGLCALGAEVVWTRLLSLLLGPTVYTFSIILAVFLLGLWFGSSLGASWARHLSNPRAGLAACEILIAVAIAWTAFAISQSLPQWPVDPWLSLNPWANFQIDVVRCMWAIFPATVLWGASFPLAMAASAAPGQDPAWLAGATYASNTLGSITGALFFSLVLIPSIGTRDSQQLLIGLSIVAAGVAGIAGLLAAPGRGKRAVTWGALAAGVVLIAWGLVATVSDVPWEVIAYGRRIAPTARGLNLLADRLAPTKILFRGEGMNSSVLISEEAGERNFYVSGKAEASTAPNDMLLERMMGDIPALVHPNPRSVLIVGFGAGITAGSLVPYPEVKKILICELEQMVPPASTEFFRSQNYDVKDDWRTRIVYDDARHYIYTTREKFDVITTDPIHPWVKGTSTLYSKEYYELVKSHLNPQGVAAQWLPVYDSDRETVKTELATFFSVFPNGTVWSNYQHGNGYDLVLLGVPDAVTINVDDLQKRLDRPDYAAVARSLSEVGLHSAVEVLATYAGRSSDMRTWLEDAPINNDMNQRLQFLAGLGLNSMSFKNVYRDVLSYRRFPDGLMVGKGARINVLRTLLAPNPSNFE